MELGDYPSVDHYVTTIQGRLYTFDDLDKRLTIGRIKAWKLHLDLMENAEQDPWEVMDAEHGELEALYSAIFDLPAGSLKPAALRAANLKLSPAHILAIHTVEIAEAYRGRRLGAVLVSRTMDVYGGRDSMAALYPYPLQMRGEEGHLVRRAQRKLSMYWQSVGFKPIPGSDWLVCNAGYPILWEPGK